METSPRPDTSSFLPSFSRNFYCFTLCDLWFTVEIIITIVHDQRLHASYAKIVHATFGVSLLVLRLENYRRMAALDTTTAVMLQILQEMLEQGRDDQEMKQQKQ